MGQKSGSLWEVTLPFGIYTVPLMIEGLLYGPTVGSRGWRLLLGLHRRGSISWAIEEWVWTTGVGSTLRLLRVYRMGLLGSSMVWATMEEEGWIFIHIARTPFGGIHLMGD